MFIKNMRNVKSNWEVTWADLLIGQAKFNDVNMIPSLVMRGEISRVRSCKKMPGDAINGRKEFQLPWKWESVGMKRWKEKGEGRIGDIHWQICTDDNCLQFRNKTFKLDKTVPILELIQIINKQLVFGLGRAFKKGRVGWRCIKLYK